MRRYVRAAAIFSAWLDQQRVAAADVDETLVTRFVTGLSRRPSSTRPSGLLSDVAYGVRLLAAHLWTRGVTARPVLVAALCESEQWLKRFDEHLVQAHSLVVGTRRMYRRYAAAFLAECAGTPTPDWSRLTVPTIAAFVQVRASGLCQSSCRSPATATRAFLRFLAGRPRRGSRRHRGRRRADHPRVEARQTAPRPRRRSVYERSGSRPTPRCWPSWRASDYGKQTACWNPAAAVSPTALVITRRWSYRIGLNRYPAARLWALHCRQMELAGVPHGVACRLPADGGR